MGWNPDREPIEYLERRLRYYKRKVGSFKRALNEVPGVAQLNYFGSKKKWFEAVRRTIDKAELRVIQFAEAINKLKND
jgi:hypothetical protein